LIRGVCPPGQSRTNGHETVVVVAGCYDASLITGVCICFICVVGCQKRHFAFLKTLVTVAMASLSFCNGGLPWPAFGTPQKVVDVQSQSR